MVNFRFNEQIRIGYSYDYTLTNLTRFNSGSHEFLVLFDLGFDKKKKGFDKSPRFF
ncbi:MAG: type IX secretion system membrane protein PorP/SprF [Flavobacterium sp.]